LVRPAGGGVRERIRGFIEEMLEAELEAALQRHRYMCGAPQGQRHRHRERQLIGTFGPVTVSVSRARRAGADSRTSEWRNRTLPVHKRLTRRAEALIAATYLAGTNTIRGGCAGRWPRCSAARSAWMWSAGPGTRCKPTGKRGRGATCRRTTSCAPSSNGTVVRVRRYRLLAGYSVCLIFLKLFDRFCAPLAVGLLHPVPGDATRRTSINNSVHGYYFFNSTAV
jgi:Transposase, Mutator family